MYDFSLPTEILEIGIESVISEYTEARPRDPEYIRFIPRWYLTPFLRVSKLWYAVCARYLYRSLAIGSYSPFDSPAKKGESAYQTLERRRLHIARDGDEIAEDLCGTLTSNPQLAALVEVLQLGIESFNDIELSEWTQTNTRMLLICPNVKHVEIRGFEHSKLSTLVDALKEKSLVSFSISTRRLSDSYRRRGGSVLQIIEMMQKWPKLRSIRVEDFLNDEAGDGPISIDTSQAFSRCCPDLTEIVITGAALHPSELDRIRAMCSRDVAKLSVLLYGNRVDGIGNAAAATLCDCLRAWSPTLQCFKVNVRDSQNSYPPLSEAISSLYELRELQFVGMMLDFGFISSLPRLERFACRSLYRRQEVQNLSRLLDIPEMFPSLRHIVLFLGRRMEPANKLQNICRRRNVQLHKCWPGSEFTADFLL